MNMNVEFKETNAVFDIEFQEAVITGNDDGSYSEGYTDGQKAGYNIGFAEGEQAGHQAGYTEGYTEGSALKDNKPYINSSEITDFRYFNQEGKRNNILEKLDTSNGTNFYYFCYGAKDLVTVDLDFSKSYQMYAAFSGCSALETVVYMDFSSVTGATNLNNIFGGCTALKHIKFALNCIKSNISFASSAELTDTSTQSIVDGLATVSSSKTLTLHADIKAKLTDAQTKQILLKGWITA